MRLGRLFKGSKDAAATGATADGDTSHTAAVTTTISVNALPAGTIKKSTGMVSRRPEDPTVFNKVTGCCVRHPGRCCLFWFLIYPAIFLPALFLGSWPMNIAADLKTYIRSDDAASTINEALAIAKQLQGKDPITSSRRLYNVDGFTFGSSDDLNENEIENMRQMIRETHERNEVVAEEEEENEEEENILSSHKGRDLQTGTIPRAYKQKSWYTTSLTLHLFYLTKDGKNIFTKENLQQIKEIERDLINFPDYSNYCAAPSSTEQDSYFKIGQPIPTCATMIPETDSVLNYFYAQELPTGQNITYSLLLNGQGTLRDINKVVTDLIKEGIIYYADRFFSESKTSNMTRSSFNFGAPFTGYSKVDKTNWSEQKAKFDTWIKGKLYPHLLKASTSNIRVCWYQNDLALHEVNEAVYHDSLIAVGSFVFVFFHMWIHLRSLFLASLGMLGIIYSFPLTYVTVYILFNYKTMMLLNFLSLFIIVGIGADDVFVFTDLFEQSASFLDDEGYHMEVIDRFRWTFRKGFMAMFLTTFTTAASFYSNATSSIVPIREFGNFMGLIVTFNFIIVTTLYPSVLLFYEYGLWSFRGYEDLNYEENVRKAQIAADKNAEGKSKPQLRKGSFITSSRRIGELAKQGSFTEAFKSFGELLAPEVGGRKLKIAHRDVKEINAGVTNSVAFGSSFEEETNITDKVFEKLGSAGGSLRNIFGSSSQLTASPKNGQVNTTATANPSNDKNNGQSEDSELKAKATKFIKVASGTEVVPEAIAIRYIEYSNGNLVEALNTYFEDVANGMLLVDESESDSSTPESQASVSPGGVAAAAATVSSEAKEKPASKNALKSGARKFVRIARKVISPKDLDERKLTKEGGFVWHERFIYNYLSPFLRSYRGPLIILLLLLAAGGASTLFFSLKISDDVPDFFDEDVNYGKVLDVFKEFQYTARDSAVSISTPPIINTCVEGTDGADCQTQACPGKVSSNVYCNGVSNGICCDPRLQLPECANILPYSCLCSVGYNPSDNCATLLNVQVSLYVDGCPCQTQASKNAFIDALAAQYGVDASQITVSCTIGPCTGRLLISSSDGQDWTSPRRSLATSQITIVITPQSSSEYSTATKLQTDASTLKNVGGYQATTATPTAVPTTLSPTTATPTIAPNNAPTTASPTLKPTSKSPTRVPTTGTPTKSPTPPTRSPTKAPTTASPTIKPTTKGPSVTPSLTPTKQPTTHAPTKLPTTPSPTTKTPTSVPTTSAPVTVATPQPTKNPTNPTKQPTTAPTSAPTTKSPTIAPTTRSPTITPTTRSPTTGTPTTGSPTSAPTTGSPTHVPTTGTPTTGTPTKAPTKRPTNAPTGTPTQNPSRTPSTNPSGAPTTKGPTNTPTTGTPTHVPTTKKPTTLAPTTQAPTLNCVNGNFIPSQSLCNCTTGYGGTLCDTLVCKGYPDNECSSHGTCVEGECSCNENYSGLDCSVFTPAELSDSETILVTATFGLKGLDRGKASGDYPNGLPIYDETFDLTSTKAQQSMLRACAAFCPPTVVKTNDLCRFAPFTQLRTGSADETRYFGNPVYITDELRDKMKLRRLVECPFAKFVNYIESQQIDVFPFPSYLVLDYIDFWLTSNPNFEKNGLIIRDYRDSTTSKSSTKSGRQLATYPRVLVLTFQIQTGIDKTISASNGYTYYSEYEKLLSKLNEVAPTEASGLSESATEFARSVTEKGAIDGTISSGAMSVGFAFGSILLFTGNIFITVYTTLTIVCNVACLMGFMFYVMGWEFGIIEAISITVFVGMSDEYILHLAHAYEEGDPSRTSYQRARDAITQMGFSLLGGALTNIGASMFLFFCSIVIFRRFGYVICMNTALSVLYAVLFFIPILMLGGPIGRWGDLTIIFDPCFRSRREKMRQKKQEETAIWTKKIDAHTNMDRASVNTSNNAVQATASPPVIDETREASTAEKKSGRKLLSSSN